MGLCNNGRPDSFKLEEVIFLDENPKGLDNSINHASNLDIVWTAADYVVTVQRPLR